MNIKILSDSDNQFYSRVGNLNRYTIENKACKYHLIHEIFDLY